MVYLGGHKDKSRQVLKIENILPMQRKSRKSE